MRKLRLRKRKDTHLVVSSMTQIVRKTGQVFLHGLSLACVDNTTWDMFRLPSSVATDVRKEMIDYLTPEE
jgi:hypothetical protein